MTGYVVHYSDGSTDRSISVGTSSTSADITGLINDGRTYSISVEATSEQLSGVSDTVDITVEARELYPSEGAMSHIIGILDLVILNTNVRCLVVPAPCPSI